MIALSTSPPPSSNSSSLHAPQSRYQELSLALDSSNLTNKQLSSEIEELVRVQWGPLIPRCQTGALKKGAGSPGAKGERGAGGPRPQLEGPQSAEHVAWLFLWLPSLPALCPPYTPACQAFSTLALGRYFSRERTSLTIVFWP